MSMAIRWFKFQHLRLNWNTEDNKCKIASVWILTAQETKFNLRLKSTKPKLKWFVTRTMTATNIWARSRNPNLISVNKQSVHSFHGKISSQSKKKWEMVLAVSNVKTVQLFTNHTHSFQKLTLLLLSQKVILRCKSRCWTSNLIVQSQSQLCSCKRTHSRCKLKAFLRSSTGLLKDCRSRTKSLT